MVNGEWESADSHTRRDSDVSTDLTRTSTSLFIPYEVTKWINKKEVY